MITGYVFGGDETIKKLQALGPRVSERLLVFMKRTAIKLQKHVKEDKLTGQVLHVRTGTLRRSITQKVERTQSGIYGVVGTNVVYAGYHEFGFKGTVSVKEHLRRAKNSARATVVSAHTRHVEYPARSFLRSALDDMRPEIRAGLEETVRGTLRGIL